jgi:mono/diheme cytochrome c family protein
MTRWLMMLISALCLSGCSLPGEPDPNKRPPRPDQVTDFAELFQSHCQGCHGADGRGGPAPLLHDRRFLAIFDEKSAREIISHGRSGTLMPAFEQPQGSLTAKQVDILAKGLRQHWGAQHTWTEMTPPYLASELGDIEAGKKVFTNRCEGCHGPKGQAGSLERRAFLNLTSEQLWRRTMIVGRPDLQPSMPAYNDHNGGTLTSREIDDVVALLKSWRDSARQP